MSMFKTTSEIKQWLYDMKIEEYIIQKDLTVDVLTDVDLSAESLEELPVQFGIVHGFFSVFGNELYTLKGCPKKVIGYFDCSHNNLRDLKYCPKEVGGVFYASDNAIKGLEHAPDIVNGPFKCYENPIEDFNGFKTQLNDNFEHGVDSLDNAIPGFEHLYVKVKSYDLTDYSLILTPQQIASIRIQDELGLELKSNKKNIKKVKL